MITILPTTHDDQHEPPAAAFESYNDTTTTRTGRGRGRGRRRRSTCSSGNGYLLSTPSDGSSICDALLAEDEDNGDEDYYDYNDDVYDDYNGIDSAIKIGHGGGRASPVDDDVNNAAINNAAIDADVGPLSSKITLLRHQVSKIDTQLANGPLKLSERRHLLDQKLEIEKTLDLLGHSQVKQVVRKRDSMDMTNGGNNYSTPSSAPAPIVSASVELKSTDLNHQAPATSAAPTTKPTRAQQPFSLFRSSGPPPARGPQGHPRGRGGVQREYSIDDIGALQSLTGYKERHWCGSSTRHLTSGGSSTRRIGSVEEGGTDAYTNAGGGGGCGGQQSSFHASDYLFLSDEIFTSPSLRNLRTITSKQSLRNLHRNNNVRIMEDVLDVAYNQGEQGKNETEDNDRNKHMSFEEYSKSSSRSSTKSTRSSTTRSNGTRRTRKTTNANASSALKDMEQPDESVVNALAELSRRQMRASSTATASSTTASSYVGGSSASWSHKRSSPTSSLASEVPATASSAAASHGRRGSITMMMGNFLNNLNAEAETCTEDEGGVVMGSSEELRTKGRVYSM